jgi:hypothetical protein
MQPCNLFKDLEITLGKTMGPAPLILIIFIILRRHDSQPLEALSDRPLVDSGTDRGTRRPHVLFPNPENADGQLSPSKTLTGHIDTFFSQP